MSDEAAYLRIGELARRTGTSPELLRAWERRYGLLQPVRTSGGFRLYSEADERRVVGMKEQLAEGLSAAEAARHLLADDRPAELPPDGAEGAVAELLEALERYDEPDAQTLIDRLFAVFDEASVVTDVLFPVLREIGDRWRAGRLTVAQEHFASEVLRGRLLGLARGWDRGLGPRALLACPPGEQHDLGLLAFGLLLRREGWRIVFLGADTPFEAIAGAVEESHPAVVVLSAVDPDRFRDGADSVAGIAASTSVRLGGSGTSAALGGPLDDLRLPADPVEAAAELTAAAARRPPAASGVRPSSSTRR